MALDDYLAKHYGAAPKKSHASKKKKHTSSLSASASPYGMNVTIAEDDDSVHSMPPAQPTDLQISKKSSAPVSHPPQGSWHSVTQVDPDPLAHLLDSAAGDEERPAIAEGAELLQEYRAQQAAKEVEKRRLRHELRRQNNAQAAAAIAKEVTAKAIKESASSSRSSTSPPPMRYGLQTAASIKEDADRVHERHMRRLRDASSDVSGRGAKTVYRDSKSGKEVDMELHSQQVREKQERLDKLRNQHSEWNKGLVQQRAKAEEQRLLESMRRSDIVVPDSAKLLDDEHRAKQHWDDPARGFLVNKKSNAATVYPQYKGYAPPNRFGIRPGYRWDGVDRSNGFEKQLFESKASSSSRRADDYAFSVADM
ncbi:Pre-mRNA-splicing factor cwc26 [Coemansia sp. RSA 988]|nr:Pre-mRNA-splicing factor cwc26 [Coemansia sp. RSA 988]